MLIGFKSAFALDQYFQSRSVPPDYITLEDAAKRLSIDTASVRELLKQGKLDGYAVTGTTDLFVVDSTVQTYPQKHSSGKPDSYPPKCFNCKKSMTPVAREVNPSAPPSNPPRQWQCDLCTMWVVFD